MASTNKTTNYELSQFLGTDKPAWLSDYNQDMSKIDAQMKLNADGVTTASGVGTTNSTAIGTLANLTTTAKTDLVSAINEVDTNADTAQSSANSAYNAASANALQIQAIKDYLNVQTTGANLTVTTTSGTLDPNTLVKSAKNTDGSLGKIYGKFILSNPRNASTKVSFSDTGLRPTENINIEGLASIIVYGTNGSILYSTGTIITIKTDGTAEITVTGSTNVDHIDFVIPPCLLFMQNFGD